MCAFPVNLVSVMGGTIVKVLWRRGEVGMRDGVRGEFKVVKTGAAATTEADTDAEAMAGAKEGEGATPPVRSRGRGGRRDKDRAMGRGNGRDKERDNGIDRRGRTGRDAG